MLTFNIAYLNPDFLDFFHSFSHSQSRHYLRHQKLSPQIWLQILKADY